MIIVMKQDILPTAAAVEQVVNEANKFPGVTTEVQSIQGSGRTLVEIYLIGQTALVPTKAFEGIEGVEKAVRITQKFRALGRHDADLSDMGFEYNGVRISQDTFHIFPGLCAVDQPENVETVFAALQRHGVTTARAGAYKPRTSPYDFQGLGAKCLPYVFELAGKYGIRIVAMEVTHESCVDEIQAALQQSGNATGVMLQIGTRNAQNFELLKTVGAQTELPVLFKRGMGITLVESLNACEYVASRGNRKIVFALRGMKTHFGDPHRNLVDFGHVPVVKRMTRLPVCIDPSHSVGGRYRGPDGLLDVFHVTAQGIVSGANMVLVDFHPQPKQALCDGPQALRMHELEHFLADCNLMRESYQKRLALVP